MEDEKKTAWVTDLTTITANTDNSQKDTVKLYISGVTFVTKRATILRYPNTKLGRLIEKKPKQKQFFFDTDERGFREILNYYRTSRLHIPPGVCSDEFQEQLDYWEINETVVSSCCNEISAEDEIMERQFVRFEQRISTCDGRLKVRHYMWYFITDPFGPYTRYTKLSLSWMVFYLAMVCMHTIIFAVMTIPEEFGRFTKDQEMTSAVEFLGVLYQKPCEAMHEGVNNIGMPRRMALVFPIFFGVEVLVRLMCCPCKRWFSRSFNMLDLFVSFLEIPCVVVIIAFQLKAPLPIDKTYCLLLNSVPYFVTYVAAQYRTLRLLAAMSLFSSMQVLFLALYASIREIGLLCGTLLVATFLGGFIIYWAETIGSYIHSNTESPVISSLPQGYWWTVVTMTTVGYGDFYPTNWFGYASAIFLMLAGLMLTSLPIAIIGGNFAVYHEYNIKRQQRIRKENKQIKRQLKNVETAFTNDYVEYPDPPTIGQL